MRIVIDTLVVVGCAGMTVAYALEGRSAFAAWWGFNTAIWLVALSLAVALERR